MSNERFLALTDEQLDWIDSACSDLEESWKRGEPVSIEQRCAEAGPSVRPYLLRELVAAEIEVRRSRGELPHPAEYESRFPDHVEQIKYAFGFASASDAAREQTQTVAFDDTGQSVVGDQVGKLPATLSRTIALDSRHDVLPRQFGRYKLQKLLGRGGMGSVYLAHDQELDRDVAIKFPEFDDRPEFKAVAIERFRREARAMAALHHANLCPVYDVGQFDGRHYLTMAYVEGRGVSDANLSQAEIVNTVSIIARALQSAHEAGIVHRYLKPSNVMLNSRGEPIVMDFGLASRDSVSESGLTHSGLIIGSPAYMAPEQVHAEHNRVGPRTDVYALGVILYQLLTHRRPFDGAGLSVLGQITSGQRPAPMSKLANVNPRLEAICLKAMAHRIEDRYRSAAELAAALDEYVGEPEAPVRRTNRKWLATAVGLASLALVALLVERIRHADTGIETLPVGPVSATVDVSPVLTGERVNSEVSSSLRSTIPSNVWTPPVNLSELNGPVADGSPTFSSDGSFVIFHRPYATGAPYHLWTASRLADGSGYGPPELLDSAVNSPETNTNPRITSDGLTLVFDSDRPGGEGARDLWFSTRESLESHWSEARNFGPNVNSKQSDTCPFLSDDGLTLVFGSDRDGGYGGDDVWIATRKSMDDIFGEPVNAGVQVNTNGPDGHPWLSSDGLTLMFTAERSEGLGGFDLWFSRRDSVRNEFGPPENAGPHVNSAEHEGHGSLSPDGTKLYFESTRPGGQGQHDIWIVEMAASTKRTAWDDWPKDAPPPAVAPFNGEQAKQHQEAWARHVCVPVVYTNSIGMKFVLIPPGEFTMGSTPEEMEAALSEVSLDDKHWQECIKSEAPQHKVILTHPMYLGVYEVTQAEYEKVVLRGS